MIERNHWDEANISGCFLATATTTRESFRKTFCGKYFHKFENFAYHPIYMQKKNSLKIICLETEKHSVKWLKYFYWSCEGEITF